MNHKRALENYERLFRRFGPTCAETQLSEVADIACCSSRHARNLLHQLKDMGWLSWEAAAGRGKRAALTCKIEPSQACYQLIDQLMAAGKTESAIKLMEFNDRTLSTELRQYLASSLERNSPAIRIPFHRPLKTLHPHLAFERTERHLVLQIFQRLTSNDSGHATADLAHHWQANHSGDQWTFHLRSGICFHNRSELTASDVKSSLLLLARRPFWRKLYQHIESVDILSPTTVSIRLSQPDWHLPQLLARPEASIMCSRSINNTQVPEGPVGSGPFFPDVVSSRLLRLRRNLSYAGPLALSGTIEIWIHKEWRNLKECRENRFFLDQHQPLYTVRRSGLGMFYLLVNNKEQRHSPLISQLIERLQGTCSQISSNETLCIATEDNNDGNKLAHKIKASLPSSNHSQFVTRYINKASNDEDVTIGGIPSEGCEITGLKAFFQCDKDWHAILSTSENQQLQEMLLAVQSTTCVKTAHAKMNAILEWLEKIQVLYRLYTKDFTITAPVKLQGITINHVGWCDFSRLWINDTAHLQQPIPTVSD